MKTPGSQSLKSAGKAGGHLALAVNHGLLVASLSSSVLLLMLASMLIHHVA